MEPVAVGVLGLGALVALIAIRVPVAYAMIVVGGVGIAVLNGPGIVLSQLKDLAYGQFSIYDLSVVPPVRPDGGDRLPLRPERGSVQGGECVAGLAARAASRFRPSPPAPDRRRMRQLAGHGFDDGARSPCPSSSATGTPTPWARAPSRPAGVLGILIPPSVILIIYSVIVEANIVTMFAAALIPG